MRKLVELFEILLGVVSSRGKEFSRIYCLNPQISQVDQFRKALL